jgi:hypothetical protein
MRTALTISMIAVSSLLLAGPANAARVFEARTSALTPLSPTVNQMTTVLQLAIPAGRWVINSNAIAVNFGTYDIMRCQILKGTKVLDASGTNVGQADGLPVAAHLVNQVVFRTLSTTTISLRCNHTEVDQTQDIYIDLGASLIVQEIVP